MAQLRDGTVQAHLDGLKTPLGLSPPDYLAVALQIARGMRAAHSRGVFHRDLKPDNVLVVKKGERWYVRIIDFGLAVRNRVVLTSVHRPVSERNHFGAGVAGTADYAPPEQMGKLPGVKLGPYSDVYAFGKLSLYTLFKTTEPKERHWKTLPTAARDGLRELLEKCTEHQPEDRYPSFEPVVQCLEALTADGSDAGRGGVSPPGTVPGQDVPTPAATVQGRGNPAPTVAQKPMVVPPPKPQRKPGDVYTNALGMKFAWIPPGTFTMGSPPNEPQRDDDETPHQVTLTKGFHLGIHQVTQAQWQAVMGANPSKFKGDNLPVENVSWDDSVAFCKALGQTDGKTYRLPTEAEWEYACRAGTTTPFHFGATISTAQANYDGNYTYGNGKKGEYRKKTTLVGGFPANAWGLFDMHGNVWEWCEDWFSPYPKGNITDQKCTDISEARVLRGGSWIGYPGRCRSACRYGRAPGNRVNYVGCRVALCLD